MNLVLFYFVFFLFFFFLRNFFHKPVVVNQIELFCFTIWHSINGIDIKSIKNIYKREANNSGTLIIPYLFPTN